MAIFANKNNELTSTRNYPDYEVENNEKDFSCIFDMGLDTKSPFSSIILDSITRKMTEGSDNIPFDDEDFLDEYNNLLSTLCYINDNYRFIRNLVVDDEDFSVKIRCGEFEDDTDELQMELYIDTLSVFYGKLTKYLTNKGVEYSESDENPEKAEKAESEETTHIPKSFF